MTEYEWKLPDNWDDLLEQSNAFAVEWEAWKAGKPRQDDKGLDIPTFQDSYKGWACIHGSNPPDHNHTGRSIEELIIEINLLGADVRIAVDQWWGIWSNGTMGNWGDESDPNWIELEFSTFIQADKLHDGLEKTYDVWKSRWEFHHGREWYGSW